MASGAALPAVVISGPAGNTEYSRTSQVLGLLGGQMVVTAYSRSWRDCAIRECLAYEMTGHDVLES